jgi:hypothetical protein
MLQTLLPSGHAPERGLDQHVDARVGGSQKGVRYLGPAGPLSGWLSGTPDHGPCALMR